MFYLHAEKGKDEDEEEEEEEQGEDGGDGVRQSQHQVSQARPVPDIMMCKCVIPCSKCQNKSMLVISVNSITTKSLIGGTHLVTLKTLKSLRARRAEMPKEPALK